MKATNMALLSVISFSFFVFGPLTNTYAATQRVDGPANFRESPNGKVLAILDDGVNVCVVGQSGQWFKVTISLLKEDGQIAEKMAAGSTLISDKQEKLGKVVSPFTPDQDLPDNLFAAQGFLYYRNLRIPKTVEGALLDFVRLRKKTVSQPPFDLVKAHISEFQYNKWREPWGPYTLYESTTCDPYQLNPLPSIVLITLDDQLVGFIHHQDDRSFSGMPRLPISGMWNLVILGSPSKEERQGLIDRFQNFLEGAN